MELREYLIVTTIQAIRSKKLVFHKNITCKEISINCDSKIYAAYLSYLSAYREVKNLQTKTLLSNLHVSCRFSNNIVSVSLRSDTLMKYFYSVT